MRNWPLVSLVAALLAAPAAIADIGSRIWATGGVTTLEGSAGGGLVPWALLGSYASDEEWWDLFVAWVPDRRLAVNAAMVNLGDVATLESQQGLYLSLQGSF